MPTLSAEIADSKRKTVIYQPVEIAMFYTKLANQVAFSIKFLYVFESGGIGKRVALLSDKRKALRFPPPLRAFFPALKGSQG